MTNVATGESRPGKRSGSNDWAGLAVSPDGKEFMLANPTLTVYDDDLKIISQEPSAWAFFRAIAWNPTGDSFITTTSDPGDGFELWSPTGEHRSVLEKADGHYSGVSHRPGGELVAMRTENKVLLGNPQQGFKQLGAGDYWPLSWSFDGKYLAAGNSKKPLEIYDSRGKLIHLFTDPALRQGEFAPDKDLLVIRGTGELSVCSAADNWQPHSLDGFEDCGGIRWSPDGRLLYVENVGVLQYQEDGTFTKVRDTTFAGRGSFAWAPDGKSYLRAYASQLEKYRTSDNKLVREFYHNAGYVCGLSHHPTRNQFTTCQSDSTIITWNAETMEPYWRTVLLPGHQSVTITAAGQILHGDRKVVDEYLAYYYETDDGRIETVTPTEFEKLIGESIYVPQSPATATNRNDREIAEWVFEVGGKISTYTTNFTDVADLPKEDFAVFGVDFYNQRQVNNDDLERLKDLQKLTTLNLMHTGVGDAGLEHLKGLSDLNQLSLGYTQVSDAGLMHLKGFTKLEILNLHCTAVGDKGVEHLQELTNLSHLELSRTKVSDEGLRSLAPLTQLKVLTLMQTQVSDAGLQHLTGLTNLTTLDLTETQVTDAGLKQLAGLTRLTTIRLSKTKVTAEGIAALQKALPVCAITHDYAEDGPKPNVTDR